MDHGGRGSRGRGALEILHNGVLVMELDPEPLELVLGIAETFDVGAGVTGEGLHLVVELLEGRFLPRPVLFARGERHAGAGMLLAVRLSRNLELAMPNFQLPDS